MEKRRRTMTLGLAVLSVMVGVMAVAVLLWAAGSAGASPPTGPLAQGGAPLLLNYQGRLADPTTTLPKPDGPYTITFKIHDAETGGSLIWSETQVVTVTRGLFNVLLGSSTALSVSDFDGTSRWLELEIDEETLSPRVRMVSVPYAIQAEEAKNAWSLTGNAGTNPTMNFLGTTDNQALELRVNNTRALRLEPDLEAICPNIIGGYSGNSVTAGVVGATIGGGGQSGYTNRVTDDYGTVGGGYNNQAGDNAGTTSERSYATIGGGLYNRAEGWAATVGGGYENTASHGASTIGGGYENTASGEWATVGGGYNNTASGEEATVGGGGSNDATGDYATICGGWDNLAGWEDYATVCGGYQNAAGNHYATIGGGLQNRTEGWAATVGGGQNNQATAKYATVPGGYRAKASLYGQMAYASGYFGTDGDAQASLYVLRKTTNDATPRELYLDGSSERLTVASGRTMTLDVLIVARSSTGQSAGYRFDGVIENDGGTTRFLIAPTVSSLGEDNATWDVSVEADDTNDALVIKVTGAESTTIRWVATVRPAEVSW